MKRRNSLIVLALVFAMLLALTVPAFAAEDTSDAWQAYLEYAAAAIEAQEEADFLDQALDTLWNESLEDDPTGWPFDMFVGNRKLFDYYDVFLETYVPAEASDEASAEASGETSGEIEVTNEGFGSYVSYLRDLLTNWDGTEPDAGGAEMALGELDSVAVGNDVTAFPFDMLVELYGAMTYAEFMADAAANAVEAESQEAFDAYVAYLRDYMENYDGAGTGEGFDEDSRTMALDELDNVAFGTSSVNGFPFVMFINEFGAQSYADFIAD